MKTFVPFAHAKSIYEIDISFYKEHNVKVLFCDLDNTLDSFKAKTPKQNTIDLFSKLRDANITPVIISNNKRKRVEEYVSQLDTEFLFSAKKPFAKKINSFIKNKNISKDEVMLVGDQLLTDVLAGHNAKIRVVLTDKIVKEDQFTTHFNRLIDKPIRRRLSKKGLLIDWREKHVAM